MDDAVRLFDTKPVASCVIGRASSACYSAALREAAVAHWRVRERAGEWLAHVAHTLGVAPASLNR